jgi:hypothetical protein
LYPKLHPPKSKQDAAKNDDVVCKCVKLTFIKENISVDMIENPPSAKPNKKGKSKVDENVLFLKNITEIITKLI